MPVDIRDVMQLLANLSTDHDLKVTLQESVKGGLIALTTTTAGGLLAGPPGLAIGGGLGGALAYFFARNKFKPVAQVILEMPMEQKQILYNSAMRVICNLDYTDALALTLLVQGNPTVGKQLLGILTSHMTNELHLQIVD